MDDETLGYNEILWQWTVCFLALKINKLALHYHTASHNTGTFYIDKLPDW